MNSLDPHRARQIVQQLGDSGQPPEFGVQYFTVGLEPYLNVLDQEYLSDYIKDGGSNFKLVVGAYGGGKTHFLYCIRTLAWDRGFAASYVSLKSGGECPFDRLDLVYKAMINGLLPPINDPDTKPQDVQGIENFLRYWYAQRIEFHQSHGKSIGVAKQEVLEEIDALQSASVRNLSFRNAIVLGLKSIAFGNDTIYGEVCQYLKGESTTPTKNLKIKQVSDKIDTRSAFSFIRSLAQMVRKMGYMGLVVLLDEAEQIPSMGRKQRDQLLNNLREFIDECGHTELEGMMVSYAVPDLLFLNGSTNIYQALNQRLATIFKSPNYSGVRIELDNAVPEPTSFLRAVGEKIKPIYETAYSIQIDDSIARPLIDSLANSVVKLRFMDAGYKRLFVQRLVQGFAVVRREGRTPSPEEME